MPGYSRKYTKHGVINGYSLTFGVGKFESVLCMIGGSDVSDSVFSVGLLDVGCASGNGGVDG